MFDEQIEIGTQIAKGIVVTINGVPLRLGLRHLNVEAGFAGGDALIVDVSFIGIPVECTSATASWCPRCGTCRCERPERLPEPTCPLHGWGNHHAADSSEDDES